MLLEAGPEHAKPLSLPADSTVKLFEKERQLIDNPFLHRNLIGKLFYLTVSRPDISYIVHHVRQFIQSPQVSNPLAVQRVLRYLKGTSYRGLLYASVSALTQEAYCESDWRTCVDTARSFSGYCLLLGSSLISWQSKNQKVVSRSELHFLADTSCELFWMHLLASEFISYVLLSNITF